MQTDVGIMSEVDRSFRSMADKVPVLIWETDVTGVISVNGHYLDFFGETLEGVHGMGWAKYLHPEDAAGYIAVYAEASTHRQSYEYSCRFLNAAGDYRWLRNSGVPIAENIYNSNGNPWTADYLKISGELDVDLRNNIAAESRAKITYERLMHLTDDPGSLDALQFLMTREITLLKAFSAALDSLGQNRFQVGMLPPTPGLVDTYYNASRGSGPVGKDGVGNWINLYGLTVADTPAIIRTIEESVPENKQLGIASQNIKMQAAIPQKDAPSANGNYKVKPAEANGSESTQGRTPLDVEELATRGN